jgi:Na+/melibiose symporter-like transporter
VLFFLFNTFTNIPYDALGPEMTDNQKDRSKLFFVCTLFDGLGAICAAALPVIGE